MSLSRGELKSLALHQTLARRLRAEPVLVAAARARLTWLRVRNPAGARYYDEWERLLDGPLEAMLEVMTDSSTYACAMRQENPFVDLVDQKARARIFREVADAVDAGQS